MVKWGACMACVRVLGRLEFCNVHESCGGQARNGVQDGHSLAFIWRELDAAAVAHSRTRMPTCTAESIVHLRLHYIFVAHGSPRTT